MSKILLQAKEILFGLIEIAVKLASLLLAILLFMFAMGIVFLLLLPSIGELAKCAWEYNTWTTQCKNWE